MTVQSDLAAMFEIPELTHPVSLGDSGTRGYYDESGEMVPLAGLEIQVIGPVLFVRKEALPALQVGSDVTLGELGAASTAGGRTLRVHRVNPIQDGQVLMLQLGGGR